LSSVPDSSPGNSAQSIQALIAWALYRRQRVDTKDIS
jgi:hypothetical protein